MQSSLSILIPTYNYNVYPLVARLHCQAEKAGLEFEVLVLDDCSPRPPEANEKINKMSQARYERLPENIGRSAIRNLLAQKARHETLLFLDADTIPNSEEFLLRYLNALDPQSQIIYGGIVYQQNPPPFDQRLRWVYGREREALEVAERRRQPHLRFLTLNFLIRRSVFEKIRFNEEIPNLRHEDTLFALDAQKHSIRVQHIDNPVIHLGLESSSTFLQKSREACDALIHLVDEGLIQASQTGLSKAAQRLKGTGIDLLLSGLYKLLRKPVERQLLSSHPSMRLFDLYRLGYYLKSSRE